MTVTTTTNRWTYNGDAASTIFAYTNRIFADTDLKIYVDDVLQTLTTHYTVSGVDNPGGGNVTFATAPPAGTDNVVIVRDVPATQSVDYVAGDAFPAETHEAALDRLTVLVQQLEFASLRTLRLGDTEPTATLAALPALATRANKVLAFDASGDPVASTKTLAALESGATDAAASASAASASAAAAATSAGAAATSETNAATSEANAAASAAAAANSAKTVFMIAVGDEATALTTGTAKVTFRMQFALTLTEIRASLTTVSSSGIPTFDVNEGGVSILSTKLTIDANEKTSKTAAAPAVISDSALADDAEITIDIDVAGTGAAGAKIYLIGDPA